MQKKYEHESHLLNILCQAPQGLTLKDIHDIVEQDTGNKINFGQW